MPFLTLVRSKGMRRIIVTTLFLLAACVFSWGQDIERKDTLPHVIPNVLSPQLFIPADRLEGFLPWNYAPLLRPVVHVLPVYGFDGSIGFGEFNMEHPDRFFSTLTGNNYIDIPELFISEQKMIGNTLKLGKKFYFMSGILYGAQLGVRGNNWGMGTREGLIYRASESVSVAFWTQYFQPLQAEPPAPRCLGPQNPMGASGRGVGWCRDPRQQDRTGSPQRQGCMEKSILTPC